MESLDAQSWSDLCTLEIISDECLPKLLAFLSCPSKIAVARSFQGSEAKTLVGFLDQVLEQLHLGDKHQQRCLRLLVRMCKAQGIIPTSYLLQEEFLRVGCVQDRGGFSEVSDGEYLGRAVAIKDLKPNNGDFDRNFNRFCREIIRWKHLSHPNVLPLFGVFVSKERHQFRILSEWMPNGTLKEYTRSNPEANRLQSLSEVASGVAYLHGLEIVHGDLKGANVFVDRMYTARIGDFGLMTMGDLGTIFFSESVGSMGGTFPWMSPELLESARPGSNVRPTRESDRYALGMVVYEVLTGRQPFYDLSHWQFMHTLVTGGHPKKPSTAKSLGFSDELWELVKLCWSKSSLARPTAEKLLDNLSHASPTWVPPSPYPITDSDIDSDLSSPLYTPSMNSTNEV